MSDSRGEPPKSPHHSSRGEPLHPPQLPPRSQHTRVRQTESGEGDDLAEKRKKILSSALTQLNSLGGLGQSERLMLMAGCGPHQSTPLTNSHSSKLIIFIFKFFSFLYLTHCLFQGSANAMSDLSGSVGSPFVTPRLPASLAAGQSISKFS